MDRLLGNHWYGFLVEQTRTSKHIRQTRSNDSSFVVVASGKILNIVT